MSARLSNRECNSVSLSAQNSVAITGAVRFFAYRVFYYWYYYLFTVMFPAKDGRGGTVAAV